MRLKLCLLFAGLLAAAGVAADSSVDATARAHASDKPVPSPVAMATPGIKVIATEAAYGEINGTPVSGYLARPAGDAAKNAPGLIVIHEWWGLNENIRLVTERLAGEGYIALAVDLYGGKSAATPKEAMALMQGLQDDSASADENLRQAYRYLHDLTGGASVGSIGWCLGGRWSLRAALVLPDQLDAAVIYYGSVIDDRDALATLQMPVLGNFAENDPIIPLDSVASFESTMRELGKDIDVKVYAGAQHAFSNPSGTAYNPEAAEDAWNRSMAFLARTLR